MPPLLRVEGLTTPQLAEISADLECGQCLALHGPSGAGKSLLLRAIVDLDPNSGEVLLDDQPRSATPPALWRRQLGYLPAETHWWGELVREHCAAWDPHLLERLGFPAEVLDWEVRRLSSGERARLGLARMLALKPRVLLLDEPTANLDPTGRDRVEQLVRDYLEQEGACCIWVSHDAGQRRRIGDRQGNMDGGRFRLEGEPEWN